MRVAGLPYCRRLATGLALWWAPPFFQRHGLADLNPRGFISPRATVCGSAVRLGANIFIDDRVLLYQEADGGAIELGDRVRVQEDTHVLTGAGGSVTIGADTHLHRGCQLSAYKAPIQIGRGVEIAARCALYPYDHGLDAGQPVAVQPLTSKGAIVIGDEAWLGYGVIVLSGVRIGKGAVIGAGSVVTADVPDGAIAAGVPAKVMKMRSHG
jgi:acetyltransferase-like isoleucine patch superfamily enzyme